MSTAKETEYVDDETGAPEGGGHSNVEPDPPKAKAPEDIDYPPPPLIDQLNAYTDNVGVSYEVSSVPGKGKRLDKIDANENIKRILSGVSSSDIEHWLKGALHMIG